MLSRLLRTYLHPYRRDLGLVIALQLIQSVAGLFLPSLNADIIDKGVSVGNTGYILSAGTNMLMVTLVQIVCSIGAVYYGARTAMSFGRDVRSAIFHQVGGFSAREVNSFGAPSLITRNTNDVQQVQMLVLMTCTMLIAAPIMCVGGIIMAIRQDATLSWLLVVSVPVLILSISLIIRRMIGQFRLMQTRIDGINRVLREQITGIRVVRAFVREPYEVDRFSDANSAVTNTALRVGRLQSLMFPTVMLVVNASSVAVLWFGSRLINDGSMQVGSLTAYLSYLMLILMSVMMATFMAILVPRAAVCAERIGEVLDTASSVVPPANPITTLIGRGNLELRDVEFCYPGAADPVLKNISFTAAAGQRTAIIGSTGSGKSTLIGLIPRLFDATAGSVLVDGQDVRDLDPDVLCSVIGLVPQRAYLFTGTVASNLRYGNPAATDHELWQALAVAQADDFVRAMPDGLESAITQGGTNVSGGQRQRLAIARALVRKPEIYLFDDSFSALDLGTDARLRAALRPLVVNATVIIVAQRVSTILDADQIIVLDDGEIIGRGTHRELLKSCATYAEIVDSQFSSSEAVA
ncbi:MAG: ABC transporter ATP-binding protein/permease [Actinomycetota bacterium]|nr:ABC transporter ATP-binding protein/permease [Actinomycetota bacterium]MDQ2955419.1 ABC transporter ATP-binding protein/permease [Actinomycetota bacterium]